MKDKRPRRQRSEDVAATQEARTRESEALQDCYLQTMLTAGLQTKVTLRLARWAAELERAGCDRAATQLREVANGLGTNPVGCLNESVQSLTPPPAEGVAANDGGARQLRAPAVNGGTVHTNGTLLPARRTRAAKHSTVDPS